MLHMSEHSWINSWEIAAQFFLAKTKEDSNYLLVLAKTDHQI